MYDIVAVGGVFNGVGNVADGDRAGFGKFLAVDGDLGGDGGSTCPFCIKSNATTKAVTWESKAPTVASVSSSGLVKGL